MVYRFKQFDFLIEVKTFKLRTVNLENVLTFRLVPCFDYNTFYTLIPLLIVKTGLMPVKAKATQTYFVHP